MADQTPPPGDITGNVLMYDKPEPLSVQAHGKLGVNRENKGFDFVKDLHFVPLNGNEFGAAATTFPIIFAGDQHQPLAVMGLQPEQNLFIDETNQFKSDAYVPAYVRRYPFVLATPPNGENMIVCVDRAFSGISESADLPFFKENGEPTDYMNSVVEFLKQYETQRQATELMISRLKELDLFEKREVVYDPQLRGRPGQREKVTDHIAISEKKMAALEPDVLREFMEKGYMGVIYSHLVSLFNWDRLIDMAIRRAGAQQAPATDLPTEGAAPAGGAPKAKGGDIQA